MDRVRRLTIEHADWSPTQIQRFVNDGADPEVVSLRTVQRVVTELRKPDTSGPWSFAQADPSDAALVLPVLRWAIDNGKPRPTVELAEWIVTIRRIAGPAFNLESVYRLAQHAQRGGRSLEQVEQYLSYEPWTDAGEIALAAAHERGALDFGHAFMTGFEEPRRGKELDER